MNRLGWTFDTVADRYDKMRPGYPEALYRRLFDYSPLDASCRALEVGIGSGQATLPILQTGCALTAVDPGARFCALCREKFSAYPRFSAVEGRFEEADFPPESLDLIYSATACHWVPEQAGYTKARNLLRPGGAFARFANHPFPARNNPPLRAEIDALYARFFPGGRKPLVPYGEDQAAACAARAAAYGFTDVRHFLFTRTRSFTSTEYLALLGTYSDHIALPVRSRTAFFDAIASAIERAGGLLEVEDTLDLALARRPR